MDKFNRYEFEGITIDIPLSYCERVDRYLEEYPDFAQNPVYTAQGMPLTLCIEDICHHAEPIDQEEFVDCSDCIYFRRAAEKTLFGYCICEANRKV